MGTDRKNIVQLFLKVFNTEKRTLSLLTTLKVFNTEKGHHYCLKAFNTKKVFHQFLPTFKVFNIEKGLCHFLETLKGITFEK